MLSRRNAAFLVALFAAGPALAAAGSLSGPAHRFAFRAIDGGELALSTFRGKLILVVNTASECAYTPQYEDLQALWMRYGAAGLVVLGVPSNDFGGQEPGSATEISGFCSGEYGVTFPLADKTSVVGPDRASFYAWAASELGEGKAPKWNFHKYLVSPEGRLIAAYPSAMNPRDPRILAAIEANLPAAP